MQITDCSFASRGMRRSNKSLDGRRLKETFWLCSRGDKCVSMSLILTYSISRPHRAPACSISAAHRGDWLVSTTRRENSLPPPLKFPALAMKIPSADQGGNSRLRMQRIGIAVRIDARQGRMGPKLEKIPSQNPSAQESEE